MPNKFDIYVIIPPGIDDHIKFWIEQWSKEKVDKGKQLYMKHYTEN